VLAEITDGSTNLRQFDLVLPSQCVQNMRFGQVAERQPRVRRISEFDHRLGPAQAGHIWLIADCSDCFQASQLYVAPLTCVLHDPLGTA